MLQWITCTSCGNSGVIKSESLPRELTCSHCGASRHVESDPSAQITATRSAWRGLPRSAQGREGVLRPDAGAGRHGIVAG
jgi:hypothetical protein